VVDTETLLPRLIAVAILLLFAFPVHEAAHAWMAYRRGDATAKLQGRISLNPLVHFDPFGALMTVVSITIGGLIIGWAKPTPVNPANLRDRRNGEVIVALAGPVSNWLMALAGGVVARLLVRPHVGGPTLVELVVIYFVFYNVVLGVFNLLPVPPLDGSTLLFRFLSPRQVWQIRPALTQYGIFILFGILIVAGPIFSNVMISATRFLLGF
jgi:Zn-dependent protease